MRFWPSGCLNLAPNRTLRQGEAGEHGGVGRTWKRPREDSPFRPHDRAANAEDPVSMFLMLVSEALLKYSSFFLLEKEHSAPSNLPDLEKKQRSVTAGPVWVYSCGEWGVVSNGRSSSGYVLSLIT